MEDPQFSVPLRLLDFLRVYSALVRPSFTFHYVTRIEDFSVAKFRFDSEDQAASVLIGLVKHVAATPKCYVLDLFTREQPATSLKNHRAPDEPSVEKTNWNNVLSLAERGDSNSNIKAWKAELRGRRAKLLGGMCLQSCRHYCDFTAFLVSVLYSVKGEPLDDGNNVLLWANRYISSPYFIGDFPSVSVQKKVSAFTLALHPASFDLDAYPYSTVLPPGQLMFPINGQELIDTMEEEQSEAAADVELHHSLTQKRVKSKLLQQQTAEEIAETHVKLERLQAKQICQNAEGEQEDQKLKEIEMTPEAGKILLKYASEKGLPGESISDFFDRIKLAFEGGRQEYNPAVNFGEEQVDLDGELDLSTGVYDENIVPVPPAVHSFCSGTPERGMCNLFEMR